MAVILLLTGSLQPSMHSPDMESLNQTGNLEGEEEGSLSFLKKNVSMELIRAQNMSGKGGTL